MAREIDDVIDALLEVPSGTRTLTLARIWATVDTERAIADLSESIRGERPAPERLPDDPLLGAAVTILRSSEPDALPIALAEPITEGRLAATLARHGEGEVGRYVAARNGLDPVRARAASVGIRISRVQPGPLGPSMLVLEWPVSGPHLLVVDRPAGTIAP